MNIRTLLTTVCLIWAATEGAAQLAQKQLHKPIAKNNQAKSTLAPEDDFVPKGAVTPKVTFPRIKFETDKIDLGIIKEDAIVRKEFEFTNTGGANLVILDVKGACGCTVPEYPLVPIGPGEKGKIVVTYTARNKMGPQKPEITVLTNGSPRTFKLHLETWVEQIPGGVKDPKTK